MSEVIGWVASFLLIASIGKQLHKQWTERTSVGVSKWLFLGQVVAEIGFVIYSYLGRNWVFLFTNTGLLIENLIGFAIVLHFRRLSPAERARGA